jgi:hypothetical protein
MGLTLEKTAKARRELADKGMAPPDADGVTAGPAISAAGRGRR